MYVNKRMIPLETISGRNKNSEGGESKYDTFDTFVRTFVNATMYPHQA
jgi:hypothetical protein